MNLINSFLLMAPPAEGEGGGLMSFLPLVLVVIVFYFFFIRPQMKKSKEEKQFREGLKKGDKIITAGGIHGKILQVNDTTFLVEIDSNTKMKMEKSSISLNGSEGQLDKK